MDRRQRRNENYVSNISMWVLGAVAVALLIAFGVGIVINNNQTRQAKKDLPQIHKELQKQIQW